MRHLAVSSFQLMLIRAVGVGLQALIVLYLARNLPLEDMGIFAIVYALLGMLRFLGPMGSDQVILRRVAGEHKGQVTVASRSLADASSALSLLVGLLVSVILSIVLSLSIDSRPMGITELIAVALSGPAFALMGAFIAQIRAFGRSVAAQVPEAIGVHILFFISLFAVERHGMLDRQIVLICLGISSWGVIAAYLVIRSKVGLRCIKLPTLNELFILGREGMSVFHALLFTVLSVRAPVLLAALLAGPAAAAVMDMAVRFGTIATLTTASIGAAFSPQFARVAHNGDIDSERKALGLACVLAALPALLWLGAVVFGASLAVDLLLPSAYRDAISPMILVAVSCAVNASLGLSGTLLIMSNKAVIVSLLSFLQLSVICIVAVVVAPKAGAIGIAAAMIAGALIRDGGAMGYVIRTHMAHRRRIGSVSS